MKTIALASLACLAPLLGGCVIIADGHDDPGLDFDVTTRSSGGQAGSVFGAVILPGSIEYRVSSNGCTDKESFEVAVRPRADDRYAVRLERTRTDNCRALLRDGVVVSYSFEELGLPEGADVEIENPVRRR